MDSLWRGRAGSMVFEAKIEHAAHATITRRDVNQLLGQIEAEEATGATARGAFITHLHKEVGAVAGAVTIVSLHAAGAIWGRVRALLDHARDAVAAGTRLGSCDRPTNGLSAYLTAGVVVS